MPWRDRLEREAIGTRLPEREHLLHVSLRAAAPPEWILEDMAAITYRVWTADGRLVTATSIRLPGVLRIARRFGLALPEALAFVDSHERIHVFLQLEGVPEDEEEAMAWVADATFLSLIDPEAEEVFERHGVASIVAGDFFEELLAGRAGEAGTPPMDS